MSRAVQLASRQMIESLEERKLLSASPASEISAKGIPDWAHASITGLSRAAARAAGITTTASTVPIFVEGSVRKNDQVTTSDAQSNSVVRLNEFQADPRFDGFDGSGMSVAVLDTGIDLNHPYFGPDANGNGIADRIVYQYDFADGDTNASDVNGHGSNVASIIGSQDSTHGGMAPGVNLIPLKVFTNSGAGNFGYVEQALQWCVANAETYNLSAINMSLGDSQNHSISQQLYGISDELAALAAKNVIVVSAAGNDYFTYQAQGVAYPAADPNSLAVGATYDANVGGLSYTSGARDFSTNVDRIVSFSQRSTSLVDIFAPGAIISGANATGGVVGYTGTSQASPHVAGMAALAQQMATTLLGRRLTMSEFSMMLKNTGVSIIDGDDENDNVTNTGATFKRTDVMAMGNAIAAMAAPPSTPGTPDLFSDAGISSTDNITSSSTLQFYVPNTTAGATVRLYADGTTLLGSNTSDGGTTVITLSNHSLADNTYAITAKQVIGGIESSASTALQVTIDRTAPAAPTTLPDLDAAGDTGSSNSDNITNNVNLTFDLEADTYFRAYVDGLLHGSAYATDPQVSVLNVAPGTHRIEFRNVDIAGNMSALSSALFFIVDTSAPTASFGLVTPDPRTTSISSINIAFNDNMAGFDVADLELTVNGSAIALDTAQLSTTNNRIFTLSGLSALTSTIGNYRLGFASTASVSDEAGNAFSPSQSTAETWTLIPSSPGTPDLDAAHDTGSSNTDNITQNNGNSGSPLSLTMANTIAGATVNLYAGNTLIGSADATGGSTTITSTATLTEGSHLITARQVVNGVESAPSGALTLSVDRTAPAAPPAPDLNAIHDRGISSSDNITTSGALTYTASAGSLFYSYLNGQQNPSQHSTDSFRQTLLEQEGTNTVQVAAIDAAGNSSALSPALTITIDNAAPTVSITPVTPDPRQSAVDAITIVFNEAVGNFDLADLVLTRDGGSNLLTGSSLTSSDNKTFTLSGLTNLTQTAGTYQLAFASGANVIDVAGNGFIPTSPESWVMEQSASVESAYQQETSGLVSIEAEIHDGITARNGKTWSEVTGASYSGGKALQVGPNTGSVIFSNPELTTQVDYKINFTRTGTHYIWLRGFAASGADDSLHVGFDGTPVALSMVGFSTTGKWSKSISGGGVVTINVVNTGTHTLNLWMREDGLVVDKVVVTPSSSYVPSGTGPAMSTRTSGGTTPPPNSAPTLGSLAVSPSSVVQGGNLTLTANSVGDVDNNLEQVIFYRDSNNSGDWDSGDVQIGADTSSSGGWTLSFSTAGLNVATHRFFARAKDTAGAFSSAATITASVTAPIDPVFQQAADGLVSIEAENFHNSIARNGKSWSVVSDPAGSGGSMVQSGPNTGSVVTSNITTTSPQLDYKINFTQTGTYYLWLRGSAAGGADDSVHAGLDGTVLANNMVGFGTTPKWTKNVSGGAVIAFNITTTGIHTINLWMREDGLKLDKLVLTKSSSYVPSGTGPAQSALA